MKKQQILNSIWEKLDEMWTEEWLEENNPFMLNVIKHAIDDVLNLQGTGYHKGTYTP